jgi:hypothetical protein
MTIATVLILLGIAGIAFCLLMTWALCAIAGRADREVESSYDKITLYEK